jgi:hypothetical protein
MDPKENNRLYGKNIQILCFHFQFFKTSSFVRVATKKICIFSRIYTGKENPINTSESANIKILNLIQMQ